MSTMMLRMKTVKITILVASFASPRMPNSTTEMHIVVKIRKKQEQYDDDHNDDDEDDE